MPINILEITRQLKENTLEKLDFSHHSLGLMALSALAALLKQNSSLKTLSFKFAGIDAKGLSILSDALKTHPSLVTLDLSNNYLGSQGADELVEIIKKNRSIKYLHLANNWVGHEAIAKIASAVKVNPVLQSINLNYENFDVDLIETLYGPDLFAMEVNYANYTKYAMVNAEEHTLRVEYLKEIEGYLQRNKNKLNNDVMLLAIILVQAMRQSESFFRKKNISLEITCMIFEYFASSLKIDPLNSNEKIFKKVVEDLVVQRFNKSFCTFFKKPLVWNESNPLQPQPKPRDAKSSQKLCRII